MSELWEIVRADELKVGDVFAIGQADEPYRYVASRVDRKDLDIQVVVDETEDRVELNFALLHDEAVFRRIPDAEDPRVLRRAILLMERSWLQGMGLRNTKHYIEKARKELESEDASDQA